MASTTTTTTTTSFEISKLPSEILVKIFSFLDQTDCQFGVARVCKFWLELVRFHLMEKVVVICHQDISKDDHDIFSMYGNRSAPKLTKSSCDWNIVAEKSWKFVKTLILVRVDGSALNDIITATKGITVFPPLFFELCILKHPPSRRNSRCRHPPTTHRWVKAPSLRASGRNSLVITSSPLLFPYMATGQLLGGRVWQKLSAPFFNSQFFSKKNKKIIFLLLLLFF
jgi:hypothetical protein